MATETMDTLVHGQELQPPLPAQHQPIPGVEKRMEPRPLLWGNRRANAVLAGLVALEKEGGE